MRMWQVWGTAARRNPSGYTRVVQLPTIFLAANIQGIVDAEHCKKVAAGVFNPFNDPETELNLACSWCGEDNDQDKSSVRQ